MVVSVCQPDVSVTGLFSLAEIRFMRGDGRTPRGLWAQQITSRRPAEHQDPSRRTTADAPSTKGSTQMQDTTRYQAPKPLRPADLRPGPLRQPQSARVPTGGQQSQSKKNVAPTNHPIPPAPLQRVYSSKATPESERRSQKTNSILGPTPKSEVVTKNMPHYALKRVGMNVDFGGGVIRI